MPPSDPYVVIKKYSNRRLYDTSQSRYITLEELADTIRAGQDVRVLDAKSNEDLTQATLTQIILESRRASRLLPVPLLLQLIRMSDDALAEFFGRYMTWALELYVQAKQGAQMMAPYNPFATLPFAAANAMARFFGGQNPQAAPPWEAPPPMGAAPPPPEEPEPEAEGEEEKQDLADLKREVEELKRLLLNRERKSG